MVASPNDARPGESAETQAQRVAALEREVQMLRSVLNSLPYAVFWKDRDSVYLGCNQRFASDIQLDAPRQIVGLRDSDLPWQPDEAQAFRAADQRIMEADQAEFDDGETVVYPDGSQEWFETHKIPLHGPSGAVNGILTTYINVTNRKQAETIIRRQAMLLAELSTPLIPLTDTVLVMPLVGAIDSQRAQQVLETLLDGVTRRSAEVAIIDITGVPLVDTQVANALVRAAQAVQLVGARLVLTGIRPEVAQTLVGLGLDLGAIVTLGTLQSGIAFALRRGGRAAF